MRYLVFYGAGIGDFISLLPMAQQIKKNDKNATIVCFNVSDKNKIKINKEMLSVQDYIDEIDYYSAHELIHSVLFIVRYIFKKFDYAIIVQHEDNDSASLWPYYICKTVSKKVAGYELKNRKQVKYDITIPRKGNQLFVDIYMKICEEIGCKSDHIDFPLLNIDDIKVD